MKVLIVKLSSIGDVVHTLPALKALRDGLGRKARIDWLVEEAASGILEGNPLIDEVIRVKRGWGRNLASNLAKARLIRSRGYDLVLDFQGLLKSAVWVRLSGGKRRMGFSNGRELSPLVYTEKLPPFDIERHAVERYLDLARAAGAQAGKAEFPLKLGRAEAAAKRLLKSKGIEGPFFLMITRARWAAKLWDDDRFVELGRRLSEGRGLKAVLAGAKADGPGLEKMAEGIGSGAVNLAGETGLLELAAVSRLARFVVTVDSGPMHIAAAAGARVVALFGPTAPWRTGPYGEGHAVLRRGLGCSPCFKRSCAEPRCMKEITVEEVLEAVKGLRAGKGK